MAGLVPAIHAVMLLPTSEVSRSGAACGRMLCIRFGMAGTSPAMTAESARIEFPWRAGRTRSLSWTLRGDLGDRADDAFDEIIGAPEAALIEIERLGADD